MGDSSVGTVTVMFTDLVGSTESRTRLGEEAAERLRVVHDSIVGEAITVGGGQVVKHLGDGMMATFTSAAGAVSAAVAMQQGLELRNRQGHDEVLRIRVGISTGDVTFDGDDCFGLPVVEAQRLEASAKPGTIQCAEMVMLMARGRGGHEFRPLGDLDLKGLGEPLAACEVVWAPLADQIEAPIELGLPPVFAYASGMPFAGRDDVFDQLVDIWQQCAAGGFEVVLLAGEPGIGKTRLAHELARRVDDGDGVVLGGRCDEDVMVPFQAFAAALDWYVRQHPSATLPLLGAYPGDLVRLVPDLAKRVPDLPAPFDDEPGSERLRLFQAVESWLGVGGIDSPRLLVLDDLQWADAPSLLLLRHLIGNPPPGLMVLCTYRDTDIDRSHPLSAMLADLRRMPAVTRIALEGLGDDGVRDLLIRTGGHDLDEIGLRFAGRVHRETSGNPFFLGEVLRHLAETGALIERDGRWTSDVDPDETGIPEGIREVVGRRLSRLGEEVEAVLRSAAVIGYEFDDDLLADVTGTDIDEVLDALEVASAANLAIEVGVGRHRFAHALVRETLHDELSATRRARQHRKVAQALEARHADDLAPVLTELATHWIEASAGGDPARAIELSVAAADQAVGRGAFEPAATWYERAIELMEDDDAFNTDQRRVRVQLADAQSNTAAAREGHRNALTAAREAIAAGDAATLCDALGVVSRSSFGDTDQPDPEKIALLHDALALDGLSSPQRAILLSQLATELIFIRDIQGRADVLAELLGLLPALSPREHAAVFASPGAFPHRLDRPVADRLAELTRNATAAARTPARASGLLIHEGHWALALGDRAWCDQVMARKQAAEAQPLSRIRAVNSLFESVLHVVDGNLDSARASARTMLEIMQALHMPEAPNYRTTTGLMIRRELGDLASLATTAEIAEHMGHPASTARAIAAFIRVSEGKVDAADAALDLIRDEELSDDGGYPIAAALWSEVAVAVRDLDMCRSFADQVASQTGVHYCTGGIYLGAVDRVRGLLHSALGEHDVADDLFTAAVRQHEGLRSPTWVARTQLDWAEWLVARADPDAAQVHLDAARTALGELDLPDSRRRLDELQVSAVAHARRGTSLQRRSSS